MNKIVYNGCFGGFHLSDEAEELYHKLSGARFDVWEAVRHDPFLIEVVETLGEEGASGRYAALKIYETELNRYHIDEYDGSESVITEDNQLWVTIK